MIRAGYREWVFVGLMTLFMSLAVSGAETLSIGYQGWFLGAWATSFVRAYVVVLPAALIFVPLARRLTTMFVATGPSETIVQRSGPDNQ